MSYHSNTSQQLRPRRARTRTGCLTCRGRRKRCDERKPTCLACERNKLRCTWHKKTPDDSAQELEGAKAMAAARSNSADLPPYARARIFMEVFKAACAESRIRTRPELSFQVSKNVHHYIGYTADTLATLTPSYQDGLWIKLILREAQTQPFIMDCVHAISSFHCAYLYPDPDNTIGYVKLARLSNASALTRFRSSVTRVTEHNATSTLAFTFFQVVLCIASPFSLGVERPSETIDSLRALFIALRGFYHLQPVLCPYITDPLVCAWLKDQPDKEPPVHAYNCLILSRLSHLAARIDGSDFPPSEMDICRAAVVQLYSFFSSVPLEPRLWTVILTWPVMVSDQFLDLITAHHPLALLITAHWSVPVFQDRRYWLLNKWADQTFYAVSSLVGPQWYSSLSGLKDGLVDTWEEEAASVVAKARLREEQKSSIPHQCKHPLADRGRC